MTAIGEIALFPFLPGMLEQSKAPVGCHQSGQWSKVCTQF